MDYLVNAVNIVNIVNVVNFGRAALSRILLFLTSY